ncbi:MAG: fatty acid desaturase family protein [Planctomycetota bacterium]
MKDAVSTPVVPQPAAADDIALRIKFDNSNAFQKDLKARVQRYFRMTRRSPRDCPTMYLKTAIICGWFLTSYVLLVFVSATWWHALPAAISLGLSMAAIGFNIGHDGGHRAYSRRKWINKLTAMSLDLLGGSSFIWAHKHNALHHTYANIAGHDADLDAGPLVRMSPHQKRWGFHRLQHLYTWALYGFLPIKWHVFDDFRDVARGRLGNHRFARPRGWDLGVFIGGKAIFFFLAFVGPVLLHPLWVVLLFYAIACWIQGLVMSVVFQLAHVVEEADFPLPDHATGRMPSQWAVHQVETTVDFARRNRLLSWYVGGLNFQIEHHLFPGICHVHYPQISRIVEKASGKASVRYHAHRTFFAGIRSHFRWLREMGRAQLAVRTVATPCGSSASSTPTAAT